MRNGLRVLFASALGITAGVGTLVVLDRALVASPSAVAPIAQDPDEPPRRPERPKPKPQDPKPKPRPQPQPEPIPDAGPVDAAPPKPS